MFVCFGLFCCTLQPSTPNVLSLSIYIYILLLYSFFPLSSFARQSHPKFLAEMETFKTEKSGGAKAMGMALKRLLSTYADIADHLSARGFMWGYAGGTTAVLCTIIIIVLSGGTMFGIRLIMLFVGAWWFLFSFPMVIFLEKRPGPPLPSTSWLYFVTFR